MPSKAQRAASRQARLSRRRRRGKGAPQNFEAGPTQRPEDSDSTVATATRPSRRSESSASVSSPTAGPGTRPTARPRRRSVDVGASNVSRFLGRELRQIAAITCLIAVILAGLTFVLG